MSSSSRAGLRAILSALGIAAGLGVACSNHGGVSAADGLDAADGADAEADAGTAADAAPSPGMIAPSPVGADQTVALFRATQVYFTPENHRTVDVPVDLPAAALNFRKVTLHLTLGCPNGKCDWWDRFGRIAILRQDDGAAMPTEFEIMRFVTPYRVGMSVDLDVSPLRPLLSGHVTARVFIDTWVGPGHANGDGWLVDASLDYEGGVMTPAPLAVLPVWAPQGVVYGNPAHPAALAADVALPAGAHSASIWSFVTGHGQGNADNCAEFCARDHALTANGASFPKHLWREDCATTAAPHQHGTYQYPRAGWCPGALVAPWTETIDAKTLASGHLALSWTPAAYENTCRPDAMMCSGCSLGTGCTYDGGAHTEPNYQVSALLVVYR